MNKLSGKLLKEVLFKNKQEKEWKVHRNRLDLLQQQKKYVRS